MYYACTLQSPLSEVKEPTVLHQQVQKDEFPATKTHTQRPLLKGQRPTSEVQRAQETALFLGFKKSIIMK